jgi:putative transposase
MQLRDGRFRKLRGNSHDPDVPHSLTFSTFHQQPFLQDSTCCGWLVDALERARSMHRFHLWAYVIMPEHVHLLLWPNRSESTLAATLTSIKVPVTRRAESHARLHAPHLLTSMQDHQPNGKLFLRFWQRGGGYDRHLVKPETIHNTIEYIHRNPVRRELVEQAEDWRWSSAAFYAGREDVPLRPDVESIPDAPLHRRRG